MIARMVDARTLLGHRRQIFYVGIGGFDDHDSLADHGDRLRVVADLIDIARGETGPAFAMPVASLARTDRAP